jgi:hypothetical protein
VASVGASGPHHCMRSASNAYAAPQRQIPDGLATRHVRKTPTDHRGGRTHIGRKPQGRVAPPFGPVRPSEPPEPQTNSPKGDTPKPSITTQNFPGGLKFMSLGEVWRLNEAERVELFTGRREAASMLSWIKKLWNCASGL